jgi:hypothetical protein
MPITCAILIAMNARRSYPALVYRLSSIVLRPSVLVLLLTLPALWPLLRQGFFVSDDGLFHVYRVAALADAWGHGVLYPRLFPDFGFGYGQAVLNFYAPLTYVPGALLAALGVNPATAVEITIALGFVLAALAIYGTTRSLWGPVGGVLAAVAYTYFPYHLADAYLRGAVPEFFAFIWPPLILWATTDAFRKERPVGPLLWGALAWTGLIFTHNLTALTMIPVWIVYALLMAGWTRRWRRLIGAAGSLALALGMSAPLWLPFLVESRWVGLSLGPSDGYKRHLAPLDLAVQWQPLYQYRVQHGGVADHPLSWLTVGLFLLVLGLFVYRLVRRQRVIAAPVVGFGLALTAASAFMITLPSLPLWKPLAPILANLQYPWRFLTLTALGFAMCVGALPSLIGVEPRRHGEHGEPQVDFEVSVPSVPQGGFAPSPWFNVRASWKWILLAAVVIALILQPLLTTPAQPLPFSAADAWAPDRMWREDAEAGQVGATWTGEFLPLAVTEQRWALGRPREGVSAGATDGPVLTPRPEVRLPRVGYDQAALEVKSAAPLSIRLHQFHLPVWRAWLDGQPIATRPTGELGLVTADLPAGGGNIAFRFGPAPDWLLGGALAVIAALIWAILAYRERRQPGGRKLVATAAALLLVVAFLGLNRVGVGQQTWTPRPADAVVGDVALLVGSDATPARGANALDVTLYWLALRDVGANYKVFVHLLGPDGAVIAQHDGDPVGGYTSTSRWRAGELIADRHRIPLPPGISSGEYGLKAGMYQPEPPRNLPVDPPTPDGRVDLGHVELKGSSGS